MGEAAEAASDGGAYSRDGGAGDARAVRRRGRAARSAAQHTAAGRRVRTGRSFTVTSPLSTSRADEKQLPAAPEQVRERRAGVGGRRRRGRGGGAARQEGRAAAEGHALVGAHGRAARRRGAVRHGAAPAAAAAAAARQVTASPRPAAEAPCVMVPRRSQPPPGARPPRRARPALPHHITLTFHYRDDPTRRGARASRSIIDSLFIYSVPARRAPVCVAPRARSVPRAV